MANLIKTKRGLDIAINGAAEEGIAKTIYSQVISIIPDHYHGITPKMLVKEGDSVLAGTPLFYSKTKEQMKFVSPVSGTVKAVHRGDRRKLLRIEIECDKKNTSVSFAKSNPALMSAEAIKDLLLESGLWAYIKQRPYDVIANPDKAPKAIFISSFDSSPLAPNNEFVLAKQLADFQTGIDALKKLTTGKVHLGVRAGSNFFKQIKNVEITNYQGPHPIGNVGIQINQIDPINKGEVVWTIQAQDLVYIGRLFNKGVVDLERTLAITGPEVIKPHYINTIAGTSIDLLVAGNTTKSFALRYISGNVLTGLQIASNGILDPYATQITVLKEGEETHEMFGWALPRINKFSASGTYFTGMLQKVFGKKDFDYDARLLGGVRAIVMSGEYDKVLPMDIYPEFLIKAMIAGNIDKMEALGAYEIAPEDLALCEFVCTSKLPLQHIVREALDTLRKELE
ncbi:MAG: NADH:ubiquinone reductase (Na(+)-transporting) subunit A [Porphyromonadaceae bacterium CG2_30_38_12]|nr:MAG: NADH:ubiquinone reductase (Na(+)-transporting) subunit A [Porphyromonadaceae bacterium CG2_30_38_12]